MKNYPLLFSRHELVEGNGFIARVAVSGRALLVEEDGDFWVEGVNPGGFAASGKSPSEALAEFCAAFQAILFDIAADAKSFEELQGEVQKFFEETSAPALREWEAAVLEVRAGTITADWLDRRPADSRLGIEVTRVSHPTATNNELGDTALAA